MRMCVRQTFHATATLALLPLSLGCGGGLPFEASQVTGNVTYQGRPLDHGEVIFVPDQGTPGPSAIGPILSDGSFTMCSGETPGVAAGTHRVTVFCRDKVQPGQETAMVPLRSLIPLKYNLSETSGLVCEVKKGEDRVFNIALE